MDVRHIRKSVVTNAGEYERQTLLELQYDGHIPEQARAVARWGSFEAAQLVGADDKLRTARYSVRQSIQMLRSWQARPKGYAADVIDERIALHRRDITSAFAYYRSVQDYVVRCDAAYQAMLAGARATGTS